MDTEMILGFFRNYGWQLGLLALSGMVILGFLKWVGCFKKLPVNCKKYVYYAISCALSIIACTIYILINHSFEWISWLVLCGAVILFSGATYTVWENTGLRAIWKKVLLDNIAKLFKLIASAIVSGTMTKEKLEERIAKLGVDVANECVAKAQEYEAQKKAQEQPKTE